MLAKIISYLTEPLLIMVILSFAAANYAGLGGKNVQAYISLLLLVTVIVALGRFIFAKIFKTNWDVSDQKKRLPLLCLLLGITGALYWRISVFGNYELIAIYRLFFIWLLGFLLITRFKKISGHIGVYTFAIVLLGNWFGSQWLLLLAAVPLIAWSRLYLQRHTIIEVVGGFFYSVVIQFLFT